MFISHLYKKEWRLEEQYDSTTIWKCQNSVKIIQHPHVHLEFLLKAHILEILES